MPQYVVVVNAKHLNIVQKENVAKNVIRIISVLKAYYGTNAYCVRIKSALGKTFTLIVFRVLLSYETDNINSFRM